MMSTLNRTGCLAKGVAHGERIGQELLALAIRARTEERITDEDWRKLPSTPEGMVNLLFGQAVEKRIVEALLETYS
jgi:hypothetical protein